MSKKFDISDVKVGWTVQLNSVAWDVPRERFQGVWGKVETIHGTTLTVLLDGDMRVHFPAVDNFILNAVPPEPVKDPFAVGEWVVCVRKGVTTPANPGDIIQITDNHWSDTDWFADGDWGYEKSRFRPATPEEIASYKAKYEAEPGHTFASLLEESLREDGLLDPVPKTYTLTPYIKPETIMLHGVEYLVTENV